jgi:hypothetical protein
MLLRVVIGLTPVIAACVSNVTHGSRNAITQYRIFIVASRFCFLGSLRQSARAGAHPAGDDARRRPYSLSLSPLFSSTALQGRAVLASTRQLAPPDS